MGHPPWLRFQAYVIGLPKTGSTSLATVFGRYRTGHEIGMRELLGPGMAWRRGTIDAPQFWAQTTPRLTRPALEMDSATSHHLYADLLVERFPQAVFIHTIRDVGGWVTSLLDMAQRYRYARTRLGMAYEDNEIEYMALMSEGKAGPYREANSPDVAAVAPMMRFWADHMHRMAKVLPANRGLVLATNTIGERLGDLAELCGIPVETLRADLAHANRAPHTLDRLALYRTDEIRATYDEYCADLMKRFFPREHEQAFEQAEDLDWDAHCVATEQWVIDAIETHGPAVGR